MTLTDYINANADWSDDLIAMMFNARADAWQAVPSHRVLAWMGEAGRTIRLKRFVAGVPADAGDELLGLASAVETVLLAVSNPATELLVDPTSPHRVLLAGLVQVGILTAGDADALIARGRVSDDVTAEDVAAERGRIELNAARNACLVEIEAWASYARDAVNAATSAAELPNVPSIAETSNL